MRAGGGTGARPLALFVLGMTRSGTSALARVLSLCGGTLPPRLIGASKGNPLGYWEPREAVVLDEKSCAATAAPFTTRHCARRRWFDAEENTASIAEIQAVSRRCRLRRWWSSRTRTYRRCPACGRGGASSRIRRRGRDCGAPPARGQRVVPGKLSNVAGALECLVVEIQSAGRRDTRGLPRVFVEYANLLDDWRREVKRISAALAIDLNTGDEDAIEEFLTPDQRHQRHCGPVMEPFGTDWISTVYEELGAAARDEPWDQCALDRVFEAYRASEHGFRTVFEDSHRFNKVERFARPPPRSFSSKSARWLTGAAELGPKG